MWTTLKTHALTAQQKWDAAGYDWPKHQLNSDCKKQ